MLITHTRNEVADEINFVMKFEFLSNAYRVTYSSFNIIKWEQEVTLSWWRAFLTGKEYTWKTIYHGHIDPIEKCLEAFNRGIQACNKE